MVSKNIVYHGHFFLLFCFFLFFSFLSNGKLADRKTEEKKNAQALYFGLIRKHSAFATRCRWFSLFGKWSTRQTAAEGSWEPYLSHVANSNDVGPKMTNSNVTGIDNLRYELCGNLSSIGNVSDIVFCENSSNVKSITDPELGHMERMVATVVIFLFSIIVIVGLIGNSMVVIVVAFNQQMRSTTNLLIINLAVADLLFIIFCVPFTATDYVLPFWPFGDLWCKCVQYLIVVTAYASVYTLVLMSLDRFLAVVHPIASMYVRTEKNANTAILIIWGVILILAVPVLNRHGEVTYTYSSEEHTVCVFLDQDPISRPDGYSQPVYQVVLCWKCFRKR